MNKKLFVGNLPHSYNEADLRNLFAKYPTVVSVKIIMDRETNRPKGFGFVEFSSADEADQAISELHGTDAGGRALVVNEARPQEKREFTPGAKRPFNNNKPRKPRFQ